ncbi:unannotated protein [freshwater metagenome]|uniref:Unannotated protein n=1 Tax=freshwater metagenome TaxID=449393 RepID=A0A6J7PSU1_9ZZZZ
MSIAPITTGCPSFFSITEENSAPIIAAGTADASRSHASLASGSLRLRSFRDRAAAAM